MDKWQSTYRAFNDETFKNPSPADSIRKLANSLRAEWSEGKITSLASFLKQNPELCEDHSLIIDLAVDEYQLLRKLGRASSIEQFCRPFSNLEPTLQSSIFRQLEVHKYHDDSNEQINWPEVGECIASYHVLEELGRGAHARAFLCAQNTLGNRHVVVSVSSRGEHEGQALGKLQHPHIMPVHSIEMAGDQQLHYLCMPYLGKSTLQDLVQQEFSSNNLPKTASVIVSAGKARISSKEVPNSISPEVPFSPNCSYVSGILQLGVKLASALSHAHKAGVLHSDLKPNNVLLTPTGEPVLLDFNLARDNIVDGDKTSRDVRGTFWYMAPEQISKLLLNDTDDAVYDERSEVYSFGVVLYELLSGKLPYDTDADIEDASLPEFLLGKQKEGPISLRYHNPGVCLKLERKINRCLAFEQEQRYQSMTELQAALLQELTVTQRLKRWMQSHRRLAATTTCVASLLFLSGSYWLATRPPYAMREYQRGITLQSEGRFEEARAALENAIRDQPDFVDAKFEAACASLEMGQIEEAQVEFAELANNYSHPESMAYMGYCFNLRKKSTEAIPWYEAAIEAGLKGAWIYNNLVASYDLGNTRYPSQKLLELMERNMRNALALAPNSLSILQNAVLLDRKKLAQRQEPISEEGLQRLKRLIKHAPDVASTYNIAPYLYASAAKLNPLLIEEAFELLFEGCSRSVTIDMRPFEKKNEFRSFYEHPRFRELQQKAKEVVPTTHRVIPRFLEPAVNFQ